MGIATALIGAMFFGLCLGSIAAKRLPDACSTDRAAIITLAVLFPLLIIVVLKNSIAGIFLNLSAAKLTPTIALAYGFDIFAQPSSGPILNTIYPPLAYILYLPAAIASSPTNALLIAGAITTAFFFIPLFLLIQTSIDKKVGLSAQLCAGLACIFVINMAYSNQTTKIMASQIHVNALTIGLGLLSCLVLMRMKEISARAFVLAGLLAAAAVWVKQTEVMVVFAQVIFVWIIADIKNAILYGLTVLLCALCLGIVFVAWFGFEELWFNIFFIPSQHEVDFSLTGILHSTWLILRDSYLFLLLVFFAAATTKLRTGEGFLRQAKTESWFLPTLAAIFLIPSCFLGHLKVGGYLNNLHSVYYLLAAAASILAGIAGSRETLVRTQQMVLIPLVIAGSIMSTPVILDFGNSLRVARGENSIEYAYQYSKQHPGRVYFPWLPLSSLMAEEKLYHFDLGVTDRNRAHLETTREHYWAYIPPNLEYVALQKDGGLRSAEFDVKPAALAYLDYFSEPGMLQATEAKGLERFNVWAVTR